MEKLRMGMIGGGRGSFIGAVHRMAAVMDGQVTLCCAALSQDAGKARLSGRDIYLPDNRIYTSYEEMLEKESLLPAEKRMQFVAIVTPNHVHFKPAMMALDKGFHVVLEKPMVLNLAEAKTLQKKVMDTGLLLCLTHTYTGYPLVKQARQMVKDGILGNIRKVYVEYPQGWLSTPQENTGNVQAAWRIDPAKSGAGGALGDIGTHAANLAEYITGLKIEKMCADLNATISGRVLDDDGAILLKFNNNASGVLIATQIAAGEENPLTIRVYGEKGGLEWRQETPNELIIKWPDAPRQVYRAGTNYLCDAAKLNTRVPAGHPEGYIEAFANIYKNFAKALRKKLAGENITEADMDFPTVEEGVRGMAFIENAVASGESNEKWTDFVV